MKEIKSQEDALINHLLKHKTITSIEAIQLYGITRLSAKIFDLRNKGCIIQTEREVSKNRYGNTVSFAKYRLGNATYVKEMWRKGLI